ncbi:MAG: hypothetical protein LBC51_05445 [Treponema sp.]|nr:hypothetical protein [Treponema sp.]
MRYPGIGLLLLLTLTGCVSTREVPVLYQYTEFAKIPPEEICATIREVCSERHIQILESRHADGYAIETPWMEQIHFWDMLAALVRVLSASEAAPQGIRYVKYLIRIRDTHYSIRGLTLHLNPNHRSFADADREKAGKSNIPTDILPHTEGWDFMEKLVREINRRLEIGFYDYEIRQETIRVR